MLTVDLEFISGVVTGLIVIVFLALILYFFYHRSSIIKEVLTIIILLSATNIAALTVLLIVIVETEKTEIFVVSNLLSGALLTLAPAVVAWIYFLIFTNLPKINDAVKEINKRTQKLAEKNFKKSGSTLYHDIPDLQQIIDNLDEVQRIMKTVLLENEKQVETLEYSRRDLKGITGDLLNLVSEIKILEDNFIATSEQSRFSSQALGEQLQEQLDTLERDMEFIENTLRTVDDISVQTKIVAINASIEAAQTSELEESGFELVADSVRALSARSNESTAKLMDAIRKHNLEMKQKHSIIKKHLDTLFKTQQMMMSYIDKLRTTTTIRHGTLMTLEQSLEKIDEGLRNIVSRFEEFTY